MKIWKMEGKYNEDYVYSDGTFDNFAVWVRHNDGGDCLKTQMHSVESHPNKPKTTLNMDSDGQKLSQNVVFRRSGGDCLKTQEFTAFK